ncbi:MAG: hypothetical protein EZS28_017485 [Streblomastix strix]|uniref:Uncharacterized protein n=1 Tax=Streblomastix strix TaxID=222440 RepID=A0A5J4VXS1_9EUKA|nr:MAG: hypothetical protein EZS28_017485 [Streblomastix strix]
MDQSADQKEQGLKDLEKLQEWDDKREIHEAKYKGILRDIDGIFSQSGKQNTGFAQIADKISFGMGTVQEQSRKSISKSFKKQIDIQSSKLVQGLPYILLLFHHYPYCINGNCAFHVEVDYKTDGFLDSISVL